MRIPFLLLAVLLLARPGGAPARTQDPPDPFLVVSQPVHLDLQDVDTGAALDALFKTSKTTLDRPDPLPEKKISIQAKGVSFWEALDDISRQNGQLRHPRRPFVEQTRRLQADPWVDYPRAYHGPFRLFLFDAARVREVLYPARADRTEVTFVLQWTSQLEPVKDSWWKAGKIRVTRIEDDTGRSLLPEIKPPEDFETGRSGNRNAPASQWIIGFQPTAPGARKIGRLDVVWEGAFVSGIEEVTFDNPGEAVGKSQQVGPMKVTLARFERSKKDPGDDELAYFDCTVRLSYDPKTVPPEWKESLRATLPLSGRLLPNAEVTAQGAGGMPTVRSQALWAGKPEETAVDFHANLFVTGGSVTSLKLRVANGAGAGKAGFTFKDVRLPEESK